eukprot:scaffold494195_cov28-Prasinocladus_malaysianus.AAC.1
MSTHKGPKAAMRDNHEMFESFVSSGILLAITLSQPEKGKDRAIVNGSLYFTNPTKPTGMAA